MLDILILGYKGYIGSFLYENWKESTVWNIHGYDHKMGMDSDIESFETAVQNADVVIYMGGITGRKQCANKSPEYVFEKNVDHILRVAYKMKRDALLIYASTAALYEGCGKNPAKETYSMNTDFFDEYTRSMYWREQNISTLTHIRSVGLRLGTVIGLSPRQRTNFVHIALLRSAVLTGIARVYDANQSRAVLWNRDLLEFLERVIYQNHKISGNNVYNVSSLNCTIAKIANEVGCHTGCRVIYDESPVNGSRYNLGFSMDTTKATEQFGMVWMGRNSTMIEELKKNLKNICVSPEYLLESKENPGECCRVCKTPKMYVVYDFGEQPSANHYLKTTDATLPTHPLRLDLCKSCYHTQLSYTVPPSEMFSDYIYLSGTSCTMREYFDNFAKKTTRASGVERGAVLDIACNDGTLLDAYKALGWKTFGYDPAKNIYEEISSKKGHDITVGFWGIDPVPEYPKLDIIVAQNVVAHVPDPVLFMQKCCDIMDADTVLYIQTSQAEMIEQGQYDTIYHEHLSFFSVKSMMEATRRSGLYLEDVEKTEVHGISYVFKIRKICDKFPDVHFSIVKNPVYLHEKEVGLYDDLLYHVYIEKIKGLRNWIHKEIESRFTKQGIPLVGYGAAAKGMTVLNSIDKIPMKYIVDDSPYKHNYYATNYKYSIVSPEVMKLEEGSLAVLIFAWNFIDEIQKKIQELRKGRETYLMVYYPKKKIIHLSDQGKVHVLYEEIDTRYTKDSLCHKTILFSHFYNEEILLRQWIRHHAPLFDTAVLINHHSNDSSVEIIREEAPDNWNLVLSGTKMFCPIYTDSEVAGYEMSFENDDWRLALTTTEFLFQTGFRRKNNPVFQVRNTTKALRFPALTMIDANKGGEFLDRQKSLVRQRNRCYIIGSGGLTSLEERFLHGQYNRFMHKIRGTNPYQVGRHELNHPYDTRNAFILKYMYSPYPDCFARKLQIKHKIMQHHKDHGFGFQHLMEYDELCDKLHSHQNLPAFHLENTNIENMHKQMEFYDKQMEAVYPDQLLGGMFDNLSG